MSISAPNLANLLDYASYRGIDIPSLRVMLKDPATDLRNPEIKISDHEFLNVFERMMKETKDPYLGLHYGFYLNMNAMKFIAQISLSASHIEQAVYILKNFMAQSFPIVHLTEEKSDQNYILTLESSLKNAEIKTQILDAVFSFLFRELRLMCSDDQLPMVVLPYKDLSEYSKYLNSKIQIGSNHSFQFLPGIVKSEINKAKTSNIEYLLPKLLQMLENEKYAGRTFSNRVRDIILQMSSPEPPSFEQVAVHFPMSNRTFQRKLREEGHSFRSILQDIKKELATYLSKDNNMKTQDIAHILGYSDPSAYLHAVKNWSD